MRKIRECMTIQLGQAGVQTGLSCWEIFCLEHGIEVDGRCSDDFGPAKNENCSSFFRETRDNTNRKNKFVPRTIFVDLEPNVIDELKTGTYRELFEREGEQQQLVSGLEDAANNFARGYCSLGPQLFDEMEQGLRKNVEACDCMQGFLVFGASSGGTGSGLTALLFEYLAAAFNKLPRCHFNLLPAPDLSSVIVEPYNTLLAAHANCHNTDCTFTFDNQALYAICTELLGLQAPTYANLNRLVAQTVSSITASLRFDGPLNARLSDLQTNLVPYPRIQYATAAWAPFQPAQVVQHEAHSTAHLTQACFDPRHQLTTAVAWKHSPLTMADQFMASFLLFRGDVAPNDINHGLQLVRRSHQISFVDWCPTNFKVSHVEESSAVLVDRKLLEVPRSLCLLSNKTSMGATWACINRKFDQLYRKRAYLHWYLGEGLEQSMFQFTQQNLACLERDYNELTRGIRVLHNGDLADDLDYDVISF